MTDEVVQREKPMLFRIAEVQIVISRRPVVILAMLGLYLACGGNVAYCQDKDSEITQEPPLEFRLEVDGKSIPVQLNEAVRIEVDKRSVDVRIVAEPYRTFQKAGVKFRYPAHFGFDVKVEPGMTIWSLDGNDAVVMMMKFPRIADAESHVVESLTAQYGRDNVKKGTAKVKLGEHELEGSRLDIGIIRDVAFRQDVYVLSGRSASFVIVLQDSPCDDGTMSDELKETIKMISKSFSFNSAMKAK